jgi:hypothetical protein
VLRAARHFDNDTEAMILFGTVAHLNVAPLMLPGSSPTSVLGADGRVPDAQPQLRPVRIRDLVQITGRPRETIRRKLERRQPANPALQKLRLPWGDSMKILLSGLQRDFDPATLRDRMTEFGPWSMSRRCATAIRISPGPSSTWPSGWPRRPRSRAASTASTTSTVSSTLGSCSVADLARHGQRRAGNAAIRLRCGLAVLALIAAALAGCNGKAPAPVPTDVARPASIQQVGATDAGAKQRFPGRLRATKRAELSFNVPGFVEAKLRCAAFL